MELTQYSTYSLDQKVTGILADMEAEQRRYLRDAGNDKELAALHRRSMNANAKALRKWQEGVRPLHIRGNQYTVPSASRDGKSHVVTADDCSCEQHEREPLPFCWHQAMVGAYEQAMDDTDASNDIPLPELQYDIEEWFG